MDRFGAISFPTITTPQSQINENTEFILPNTLANVHVYQHGHTCSNSILSLIHGQTILYLYVIHF